MSIGPTPWPEDPTPQEEPSRLPSWPPREMGMMELQQQSDCDIAQCDSCNRVGPCVSGDEGDFCEPGYGCRYVD
jgi:hypothetical protein